MRGEGDESRVGRVYSGSCFLRRREVRAELKVSIFYLVIKQIIV